MTDRFGSICGWSTVCGAFLVAGCIHSGSRELAPNNWQSPQKNPAATHYVTIDVTVSPTHQLNMSAVYEGKIAAGCWKGPLSLAGDGGSPVTHTVPIPLAGSGEHFHGQFIVDQYLPGKCGWHLQGILASVSKDGLPAREFLVAQAFDRTKTVESVHFNTTSTPSFIRFKYSTPTWAGFKKDEKSQQGITDETQSIETNIIDEDGPH